jgi:hypothetical protein
MEEERDATGTADGEDETTTRSIRSTAPAEEEGGLLKCLHRRLIPRRSRGFWLFVIVTSIASVALQRHNLSFPSDLLYHHHADQVQHDDSAQIQKEEEEELGWDVNGPPVRLKEGETLLSRLRDATRHKEQTMSPFTSSPSRRGSITENEPENEFTSFLPKVEFHDNQIPGLHDVGTPLEAAESLACRDSVKDYVINATDGKDECEGLTKAFEKTCSGDAGHGKNPGKRTLREKLRKTYRWKAWVYEMSMLLKRRIKLLFSASDSVSFFADIAVMGQAWEDARYVVENDLADDIYYKGLTKQMEQRSQKRRQLQEEFQFETPFDANTTKTTPKATKPMSLDLPRASSRVSENTLDIMNTGDQEEAVAMDETTAEEDDHSESQPASQKNSKLAEPPYDPNSPEARMCCVSILNVYQQNCSTEAEEDVSDTRLLSVVFVMMLCGIVKSIIRYFRILWLPEAAGCIIVGGTYMRYTALKMPKTVFTAHPFLSFLLPQS